LASSSSASVSVEVETISTDTVAAIMRRMRAGWGALTRAYDDSLLRTFLALPT
jgi:hypothetical protein